jgi:hypothetical protein
MNASDTLNRLTKHKRSQIDLLTHLLAEDEGLAQRVGDCGSWLRVREWINSGESRLVNANFCKKFLLCRCCAARRSGKLVSAYSKKVDFISECNPQLIPAMITLTIKNGHDLSERLLHLKTSWKTMCAAARKGKSNSKKNLPIEWNKVAGSIRSIEVTNEGNGWHPHAHAFVLLTDYVDHSALSAEWERFTGDSFVVGISKCKNGIVPGLIECLKYASKITEMTPQNVLDVYRAAAGSRFTDPQGILRGVPEPDIDFDDLEGEGLDGPYRDFIARWLWGEDCYRLTPAEKLLEISRPNATPPQDKTA